MASSGKRRLSVEEYVGKYKQKYNREPQNANDLVLFTRKLRTASPIAYGEARTYFQKTSRTAETESNVDTAAKYAVGDEVLLTKSGHPTGIIRFAGTTDFGTGIWYGVELHDGFVGKCDGSRNGRSYFECGPTRGVFVQDRKIRRKMTERDHEKRTRWRSANAETSQRNRASSGAWSDATESIAASEIESVVEDEPFPPKDELKTAAEARSLTEENDRLREENAALQTRLAAFEALFKKKNLGRSSDGVASDQLRELEEQLRQEKGAHAKKEVKMEQKARKMRQRIALLEREKGDLETQLSECHQSIAEAKRKSSIFDAKIKTMEQAYQARILELQSQLAAKIRESNNSPPAPIPVEE